MLSAGDPAPDFELPADDGSTVRLEDLKGKRVVLYFYPKDDTPGCTIQACSLRDAKADFDAVGATVLGVSPDSPESHAKFRDKYALGFRLLADQDHATAEAYGAWGEKTNYGKTSMGIIRSAFVIDADGNIALAKYNVKPDATAPGALAALASGRLTVAPLDGVRVLDLSRILAGPYCSMMLADLGADVVKVERPGSGDPTRSWGPPFVQGESTYFLAANRGKRSICVDLADPEGIALVRTLAERADIVIENFIPGGAERMGLGYAELRERRPSLVYCSISGYPFDGPGASRPGFDFAIQGEGGIMSITVDPDGDPMKVGVAIADITAGIYATVGVLAALREATASGVGSHVQVSLFDAQLAWLANRASDFLVAGETPERLGNAHPSIVPYESFRASDGYVIVAIGTDAQFGRFCREAGLAELLADARFATNPERVRNRGALTPMLARAIETETVAHWLELMERAGVPGGPVRTIPEVFEHAPFATQAHEHPTLGPIRTVRSPIALDGTRPTADAPPPLLGAHAGEILSEAGYSSQEVERLLASVCRTEH